MTTPELKQSDNGVWYVHWTEGRRSKRVSTRCTDFEVAKRFLGQWLLTEQKAPAGKAVTVAELWAAYRQKHVAKNVVAVETLDYSWANLKRHFAELKLTDVNQDVVDDYESKRVAGAIGLPSQPSTVRRELNALKGCFGWCADPRRAIIGKAQVPAFTSPEAAAPRDRWLRMSEVQALLAAAQEARRGDRLSRGERFLWLALETAARKGAICELTWDRVDFETGVIHYDVPGRKRTKKRRASVPISKALRPVLERAYAERIGDCVLDHSADVGLIVQRIAEKAGVKDVSPHVLRHTAATHMARNGVPLWLVAGVLGNSVALVESTYAKHAPDGLAGAVEAISKGVLAPTG